MSGTEFTDLFQGLRREGSHSATAVHHLVAIVLVHVYIVAEQARKHLIYYWFLHFYRFAVERASLRQTRQEPDASLHD